MSGKFEKGRWVEVSEDIQDTAQSDIYDTAMELSLNIKKAMDDYKQRMYDTGVRARKAGFMTRLKYLFTRKI